MRRGGRGLESEGAVVLNARVVLKAGARRMEGPRRRTERVSRREMMELRHGADSIEKCN